MKSIVEHSLPVDAVDSPAVAAAAIVDRVADVVETVAVIEVADQAVKEAVIEESDLSVRLLNNLTTRQKLSSLIHCLNERALLFRNLCQQRWAS